MAVNFETIDSDNDYALQKLSIWVGLPILARHYYYVARRVMVIRPDHIVQYPELLNDGIVFEYPSEANPDETTLEVDYVAFTNWSKGIYEAFTVPMNEHDARELYKAHTESLANVYGG